MLIGLDYFVHDETDDSESEETQAGMNAFLTKPVRAEVLREVLQEHLA